MGFYHAVTGYVDGLEAVRPMGGYEGPGDLEPPFFGIIFRFPPRTGGGFLV
jgi:hypothetical protein